MLLRPLVEVRAYSSGRWGPVVTVLLVGPLAPRPTAGRWIGHLSSFVKVFEATVRPCEGSLSKIVNSKSE